MLTILSLPLNHQRGIWYWTLKYLIDYNLTLIVLLTSTCTNICRQQFNLIIFHWSMLMQCYFSIITRSIKINSCKLHLYLIPTILRLIKITHPFILCRTQTKSTNRAKNWDRTLVLLAHHCRLLLLNSNRSLCTSYFVLLLLLNCSRLLALTMIKSRLRRYTTIPISAQIGLIKFFEFISQLRESFRLHFYRFKSFAAG